MKFILTISLSLLTLFAFSQEKAKAKVKLSEKQKTEQRLLKKRTDSKVTRSTTLKNAAILKNNPKAKRMQDYLNVNAKKRATQTVKRDDRMGTRGKRATRPMKNVSELKKKDMKKYPGVEWKPKPDSKVATGKEQLRVGKKEMKRVDAKKQLNKYPGVEWKPAEKRTQDEKASEKSLK